MAKSKSLVKDYMTKNVVTVSPQTTTSEVIKLMKESDHNSYPVVEQQTGRNGNLFWYCSKRLGRPCLRTNEYKISSS